MANISTYLSLSTNATGTMATSTINVGSIFLLSNDGATAITFNIDNNVVSGNTIQLKAGESMQNLPIRCKNLYYIATGGETNFRMIGISDLIVTS